MLKDKSESERFLRDYAAKFCEDLMKSHFAILAEIAGKILATKRSGNRIFIAGNGGSAATASHMGNDLLKGARRLGREGFRAFALCDSLSIVTCLANDFSYDDIYSIQLRTYAEPGDLFIAFSGSGNSPNIVNGAKTAQEMGLFTIQFGGRDGGKLKDYSDLSLIAPTDSMEQLEDMHMLYEHAIVSLLQRILDDEFDIEIVRYPKRGFPFRYALFDFDGTLSLIRQGWQDVMIPYFIEVLEACPGVKDDVNKTVTDFVDLLTGKQTIYQCIRLAEEVAACGGDPLGPAEYKAEYHRRLSERIKERIESLKSGKADPDDYIVPGGRTFLTELRDQGITLILASGTDEPFVREEVELLKLTSFFEPHIHGARDDYKTFSKEIVIKRLLKENNLSGEQLLGFGDGFVEIENVRAVGGYAVGVATDEERRRGINPWKRNRLLEAGADSIIPDYSDPERLIRFLRR
ncbi:MAG: SIS domain-containing protein [Thermoguttaceae bacterium]|jgi:phosphoheptose isomerase/phosphoglycolate phosphatase-like HAD superfamily hydrolase